MLRGRWSRRSREAEREGAAGGPGRAAKREAVTATGGRRAGTRAAGEKEAARRAAAETGTRLLSPKFLQLMKKSDCPLEVDKANRLYNP